MTKEDQIFDIISDGLTNFAENLGNQSIVNAGSMAFRDTQDEFIEEGMVRRHPLIN
jgi:hypothetical protein